jgi:hypothetical protein
MVKEHFKQRKSGDKVNKWSGRPHEGSAGIFDGEVCLLDNAELYKRTSDGVQLIGCLHSGVKDPC